MAHPSGAASRDDLRLDFDRRVRREFRSLQLSSDGGLLIVRELDDALGLSDLASRALVDTRTEANRVHRMTGLFRQPEYGNIRGLHLHLLPIVDKLQMAKILRDVQRQSVSREIDLRQLNLTFRACYDLV